MRSGVCILVCALAALAAALPATADEATTTSATTTADTTTTDAAITTTAPATTTAPTTTAPTTTTRAATTAPTTTATASGTSFVAAQPKMLSRRCASAGAAAILLPGRAPLTLGAAPARLGASAYPAAGSVLTFSEVDAYGAACRPGVVSIRSLSLFGGAVTASTVAARDGVGHAYGVSVEGQAVSLDPGASVALGAWGLLTTSAHIGPRLSAPLSLQLLEPHGGLPAGTVVLVGYAASPPPKHAAETAATPSRTTQSQPELPASFGTKTHKHRKHAKEPRPLKVTPPLGLSHYDFPVAGGADYGDTYGAERSDVADGWHHGDDLFAPLGTPVVAVADGTLSLIGYEKLGGWRLWLQDSAGNQFYYAHLSAYSPAALRGGKVKAGEVLGFLGRTGDAFTTTPHLHFEVHPHRLLDLGYDGAVDPTTYLRAWSTVHVSHIPRPVHPRFPHGVPGLETKTVWRQLLASGRVRVVPPAAASEPAVPLPLPRDDSVMAASTAVARAVRLDPAAARSAGVLPAAAWPLLAFLAAAAAAAGAFAGGERLLARRRATTGA
jgi:hypothetical protein